MSRSWISPTGTGSNAPSSPTRRAPTPRRSWRPSGSASVCRLSSSAPSLPRSKPDPLPYLKGLERTGAEAARSVAFEDSLSGVRAAAAAGLAVVGLTTTLGRRRLIAAGATIAAADFTDPQYLGADRRRAAASTKMTGSVHETCANRGRQRKAGARGDGARRKPDGERRAHDARPGAPGDRCEGLASQVDRGPRGRQIRRSSPRAQRAARSAADRSQGSRACFRYRHGPHPSRLGGGARPDAPGSRRSRQAHQLDAHVQARPRRRQAGKWGDGRAAGVVLQGRRFNPRGAGRRPEEPVLRSRRRRRARDRRGLCHRSTRAGPFASGSRSATSSPITSPSGRTISGSPIPNCALRASARSCSSAIFPQTSRASRGSGAAAS